MIPGSWLLFSHPMLLGIGYWFHCSVDASSDRVLDIGFFWFHSLFHTLCHEALRRPKFPLLDKGASAQR